MSLIKKAEEYIKYGKFQEQNELLLELVNSNSLEALVAMRRLYEDMYGGMTYNYEFKVRPAYCLLTWGKSGIDSLIEGAKKIPKSKNYSLTIELLAYVASGSVPHLFYVFNIDDILKTKIIDAANSSEMREYAKSKLIEYILSFDDDEEALFALSSQLGFKSTFTPVEVTRTIINAIASRWLSVSLPVINDYKNLINNSPDDEDKFHKFFESNPQFLDPMVIRVWSKPDLHGIWEPDFILQKSDNSYLIVEIENPSKVLVTKNNQISSKVNQAVKQVYEYRDFLLENISGSKLHFENFQEPDCLVVIGLEQNLNKKQQQILQSENRHRNKLKIVGFDWLYKRADSVRNNIINNAIEIEKIRMS